MGKIIDTDELIKNIVEINDLRTLSTKTIGEAIDKTPAVNEWISVDDRLPDNNNGVLCFVKSTTISGARVYALGNCHNKEFWFLQNSVGTSAYPMQQWEVTHWMNLPETPKGE